MQTNFQLNIQSPCHEPWEDFKPTLEGGFCASCQKNVIDFSGMTESQLVAYFRDLPTENQDLCGRFRNDQLQKDYDINSWFPDWNISDKILNYEVPITQFKTSTNTISLPLIRKMKMVRNMTMAVLTFAFAESYGQQKQISGQVVDNEGQPLPGVSISIKNTTKGMATDVNGKYNLAVDEKDILVFSFVGFEPNELKVKEIEPVMKMKEDVQGLMEVTVVGYGIMGKADLTGGGISVCRTSGETFKALSYEKKSSSKFKTTIKVLGNPTISEEVIIVSQLDDKVEIIDSEERDEATDWYAKNGFQNIESVQVYDLSGLTYSTDFYKINDGKISVNLKNVPSGMHLVRVTYSNERNIENEEVSVAKIWVTK